MTDDNTEDLYEICWLGYNEKPNYNRIWGYLRMRDGRLFTFWGVRGMKIQFKNHRWGGRVEYLRDMQEAKGFKRIDPDHYEMICPGFKQDLEVWCATAILADSIR